MYFHGTAGQTTVSNSVQDMARTCLLRMNIDNFRPNNFPFSARQLDRKSGISALEGCCRTWQKK